MALVTAPMAFSYDDLDAINDRHNAYIHALDIKTAIANAQNADIMREIAQERAIEEMRKEIQADQEAQINKLREEMRQQEQSRMIREGLERNKL